MIPSLIALIKRKGFTTFNRPYELNIIGIRSSETNSNRYDDELHVLFLDHGANWRHYEFPITTDPGTFWLQNPSQVDGTAILKSGQYLNAYRIGLHKGQYKALVQNKPVTVIRDYDRNAILDFNNGREFTGMFGINIHRSSASGSSEQIDKWSAGCQVFKNAEDFKLFMKLCDLHRSRYGNSFTYTLVDLRTVRRFVRRMQAYAAGALVLIGGILYLILRD